MIWNAEVILEDKWVWGQYPRSLQPERLIFYNDEILAVISFGLHTVEEDANGGVLIKSEVFLMVRIPLFAHIEVSRRIRMSEQMTPEEFYDKELTKWLPLGLDTGEVLAWWGEQEPSADDLILATVEAQYQSTDPKDR